MVTVPMITMKAIVATNQACGLGDVWGFDFHPPGQRARQQVEAFQKKVGIHAGSESHVRELHDR